MISRRLFLVAAGIVGLSHQALAQVQKIWRIGYIAPGLPDDAAFLQAFIEGLRALGYTEGQNVLIERRATDAGSDALPALAEELVRAKVDVIVAPTTPVARAAKGATSSITEQAKWHTSSGVLCRDPPIFTSRGNRGRAW